MTALGHGTSNRMIPSRLFITNICPCGPTARRRSARAAGVLPCAVFFS